VAVVFEVECVYSGTDWYSITRYCLAE